MRSSKTCLLVVWAVLALGACGGKGSETATPPGGAPTADKPSAAKVDLAAVKAIDCDAACKGQNECYKKFGTPAADKPETMKACMDGCAALKSDAGSEDVKLTVGAQMLKYAAGNCD